MINKNKNVIIRLIIIIFLIYIILFFPKLTTNNLINHSKKNDIIIENNEEGYNISGDIIINNDIDYIPKISVIINIYNNEFNLQKCLESIINKTLKDIEIICIYNISINQTFNILKTYATKDKRITILKYNSHNYGITINFAL